MNITHTPTQKDLFDIMRIRIDVFVCEQKVDPRIEVDEYDSIAIHFLLRTNYGVPIACCRLVFIEGCYKLGRLAVLKDYRRKGFASALIAAVEKYARQQKIKELHLNSQIAAIELYTQNGYVSYGDIFIEANIPHISMVKKL